jgi:hypothetical protein
MWGFISKQIYALKQIDQQESVIYKKAKSHYTGGPVKGREKGVPG